MPHLNNNSVTAVKIIGAFLCISIVLFQLWFVYNRYQLSIIPSTQVQKVSGVELDSATFQIMLKRLGGVQ